MPIDDEKEKSSYDYIGVEDPSIIGEIIMQPSDIENIDFAMYEYIEDLNIYATTNKGWKKVPTIWVSGERSYQIKNDKEMRNLEGVFKLPAISIERVGMTKDLNRKGSYYGNALANNQGGAITIARKINQEKTKNFAAADSKRLNKQENFPIIGRRDGHNQKNKKIVYQTYTMPAPVHIEMSYSIILRAEYQQQINEMVSPFINVGKHINYFPLARNGHTYEGFIQQDFSSENNINNMQEEERKYETKIDIKVLGYIIGKDKNQENPKIVVKENFVDVKFGREQVIAGDIPEWSHDLTKDHEFRD